MIRRSRPYCVAVVAAVLAALTAAGCGSPDRANIRLRKQIQSLQGEVARLKQKQEADKATIVGLEQRVGTVPTLAQARLDRLFTVSSMAVGRLTAGADLDGAKPGDEGFKVYVELLDQHGDEFKSSGSFAVDAFDLAGGPEPVRLGRWEFPVEQSQANWHSFFTRYEYILTCPWQEGRVPRGAEVTVKVTFTDELTGRQFTKQQGIKVNPPPAAPTPGAPPAANQPAADAR